MVLLLLVLSAVAVVVAAILLVVWLVAQDGFTLVFVSMGSAVASIVLLWAARRLRRGSEAPRRGTNGSDGPAGGQADADHDPRPVAAPVGRASGTNRELRPFPIAGYDTLWVAQIVDAVAGLDQADLAAVETREREGRRRPAVLDAVASARRGASSAPARPELEARSPSPGPAAVPARVVDEDPRWPYDPAPPRLGKESVAEPGVEQPRGASPPGSAAPPEARVGPRKLRLVALVALGVFAVDQLTKHWALNALTDGPIDVIGSLRLNLRFNTGTAFSIGSGKGLGPWITLLAIGVVVALSLGFTSRFRLGATAAGLIAGGAFGNLADRAFRGDDGFLNGAVVDFVDLQWWPTFNVADAAICVGAALLVLASLRAPS